jgi:hypothetical protein
MAAASRRKSLLQASARRSGAAQDPPDDPPPDAVAALDALEADDEGDKYDEGEDADETPSPSASVRTARPGVSVDVVESQAAGTGFRTESRDDVWSADDPNSEEVRLDPLFRRLQFAEAQQEADAIATPRPPPQVAAPPPQSRTSEAARRKLGAFESGTSNRPGGRSDADPTPAARLPAPAAPVAPQVVPDPYASAAPQPQAAQDRVASKQWSEAPTARLPADMFGTPKPSSRVAAPEAPTLRQVVPQAPSAAVAADSASDTSDGAVPATAGVLALGGAAMVSLSVAAVLGLLVVGIGLYWLVAAPGPADLPPAPDTVADEAFVDEGSEEEPGSDVAPGTTGEVAAEPGAEEVPVEAGASPSPSPRRPPPPKPVEPEPEPVVEAPGPAPVAPAPAPPPDPAPSDDEDDKKGRKRKKK